MDSSDIISNASSRISIRSNTLFSGDLNQQALNQNVQREIYKQLELLLLKKKAGDQKVTIRQGLLVTIPQVEKVTQLSSTQVSHSLEVLSNVLVQISKQNLHNVIEVLIKMCDPYLDDLNAANQLKKVELPSFKDEVIESDCEISIPSLNNSNNNLNTSSNNINNNNNNINNSGNNINNSGNNILINNKENLNSSNGFESPVLEKQLSSSSLNSLTSASGLISPPQPPTTSSPQQSEEFNNSGSYFQQQDGSNSNLNSNSNILNFNFSKNLNEFKQITEDTPLYHLLNTIYMILLSHQPNKYSKIIESDSQLATLPSKVITFLFGLLQHTFTPAIRYKAASCLQVISVTSLETITQFYINKLQSGKSDEFYREFSTYQKSAKYLEFGFHRDGQIEATSQYFAKILIEMEKVSRAVFVQSICYTLIHAYPKMFNSNTIYQNVPEPFWPITQKIYELVWKWTKKSKLKPICIRTLFSIIGSSSEFFISKGGDLLTLWSSAFKETSSKNNRKSYLESLIQYFNNIKSLFYTEAKASFYQSQVDLILPVILPKKSSPTSNEALLILEVLIAMGRFSLSIVVNKYLLSIISIPNGKSNNEFSLETKSIIFKMLYRLNLEFPEQIRYYDRTLWSILDSLFNHYDGEATPMKYLILLFPAFVSHENLKEIADKITKWTWHQELDIATMSTLGITKYLSNQPHTTFPSILLQMLTYITNYYGELSGLCKVVKNMCMIMQEFINLHYLSNKERKMSASTGIDQTTWKNLRDTCEGVSLYLLSSMITPLWSELFNFISLTGHEIFREIDASLNCSYLADYLPLSSCQTLIPQQTLSSITQLIPTLNQDLINFLIIHKGDLQNAVSFSWARLRKRWMPKQNPSWKNNLAFLLLSLRLNVEKPELSSVEDQLLTEVLTCYFQEREGRTNEELCQLISDLSLYLHPSCYDTVFRFIEQERGRDIKRKKKEVFYTQDHVITYISQLVDKLSVEEYDNTSSIRIALREMTYFWISNNQIFKDIPLPVKNHTSKLFKNFLLLDSKSTLPKGEISLNKASYSKLIFQCLQILTENSLRDETLNEMELNIQQSIYTLISEACLTDFKKDIIPYLQKSFNMGSHVYQQVAENLAVFLRRSPKHLNEYIEKSFDNENHPIGSLLYLKSLVLNFSSEYYLKFNHNCPPERLALLCLFHMVSNDEKSRLLSIQLSNDLAMREPNSEELTSLQAHFQVVFSNSLPLHIYLRSTLLYSNSMSIKYPWVTPGLFEECEHFFKLLPFNHKQTMLTLLAPWTRNFWWVLTVREGLSNKSAFLMLEALFSLTIQAKKSSLANLSSIEVLWGELIGSADQHGNDSTYQIAQYVIDFLKEKYHYQESDFSNKSFEYSLGESKDAAKMVMSFISRRSTNHWSIVMNYMIKSLRFYDPLPATPVEFSIESIKSNGIKSKPTNHQEIEKAQQQEQKKIEEQQTDEAQESETIKFNRITSIQSEEAVLAFFDDLSFEFQYQDIVTIPNLIPLLLSNILFVYGPGNINASIDSKKILNNILLSLIIQQTSIAKETKVLCKSLIDSDWTRWREKEKSSLISVLKVGLGESILEIWEKMSLLFSVRPSQVGICLAALDWYGGIRFALGSKRDGMDGLLGLSCGLWSASLTGEMDIVYKILLLLTSIVSDSKSNQLTDTSYAIIIRLASILLHTSHLQQFNGVLILLYKTMQSLESTGNTLLHSKMTEEMIDILCAGLKPEEVVNRGIGHPHTSILTLWFAKETNRFLENTKKVNPSPSICCALMLAAAVMVTMSPEDPNTKDFIEYLFEAPISTPVSKMLPLLYSHYHYSVAKTPGSSPLPPNSSKDLASALCAEFIEQFPDSNDLISNLISTVNDMAKSLVEVGGKEEDTSFLLFFINELLSNYASLHSSVTNIQSHVLADYTQLMIDLSQRSTCTATREEAQKSIPFILQNIPPGLLLGSFDFLKPYNKNGIESSYFGTFGLHTDQDIINNVYTSLYLINTYLYAVPSSTSTELNPLMKKIIDSNYSNGGKSNISSSNKSFKVAKQFSSKQLFDSFTFSFKKKVTIPKPSQILHSPNNNNNNTNDFIDPLLKRSNSTLVPIVTPPSPGRKDLTNSNGSSLFKKPLPVLNKNLSEQRLATPPPRPSTPPPSVSNLSPSPIKSQSATNINLSTSPNTTFKPPPAIPPKRQKPITTTTPN